MKKAASPNPSPPVKCYILTVCNERLARTWLVLDKTIFRAYIVYVATLPQEVIMEEKTWNTKQAAEMLGVPRRTLGSWLDMGLVKPVVRTGSRADAVLLSAKNLKELAVIAGLRHAGISMQHLRRAGDYLREHGFNPFSKGAFLVYENTKGKPEFFTLKNEKEALDLSRRALEDHTKGQPGLFPLFHVKLLLQRLEAARKKETNTAP